MEPAPGLLVTANLKLERLLGEGGMGSVWVAHHAGLGTKVAVKFIATDIAKRRPELVERFRNEGGIAAKLRSPHVVQVFDHGFTEDGTPYLAMELLEGEALDARLKREPLSLREIALIVSQTCQVLGRAHKRGVVHRDIKPGNIFLEDSEYDIFIKVLDFGIAK
ncbi:MAG: serine/threonine-protein kinase, partial [Myxococcota bacterium]